MKTKKAVVLGAGITGLAAAYKLSEEGAAVSLLEKESQVGGLAGCVERNGAIFEFGPHTFFLDEDMKKEFFRIIDRENVRIFRTNAKIKFGGRYYQYPLDAVDILIRSNPLMTVICLFDYIIAKAKLHLGSQIDDSAESWIINRFGKSLYKIYFERYTEKVWGLHPRFIASSFTEERIPLLSIRKAIKATLVRIVEHLLKREEVSKSTYLEQGYYPKKGAIAFCRKLQDKICTNNSVIYLDSTIKRVMLDNNRVNSVEFEKDGSSKKIECDYLISSIPLNELVNLMNPKAAPSVISAANSLKFRALVFVNLVVKKQNIFNARMVYFRDKTFNRISELNQFSTELVPKGLTGLCAEITCDKGDRIWNADAKNLCDRVIEELSEEGFFTKEDVVDAFITRKEHGYPVAGLHYKENLKTCKDYFGIIENLFVTGRQGLFRYLQMDHCMKMSFDVTRQIISEGRKNMHSVTADKPSYF